METALGFGLLWFLIGYVVVLRFRKSRQVQMREAAPGLYSEDVDSRFWKRFFLTLVVGMPLLWVACFVFGFTEWVPLPDEVKTVLVLAVFVGAPLAFPAALLIAWVWNAWMVTAKPMTFGEAPYRSVDPLSGKVTVKHKSRKERRKARAFAMKNFDRERRGLPRLLYGDERDAELIRATGE